jgi:hypothetical protein
MYLYFINTRKNILFYYLFIYLFIEVLGFELIFCDFFYVCKIGSWELFALAGF